MTNSSKTKILYIGPIPPEVGGKSAGGVATHTWQLATQAAKRGYEVYILANTTSSFTKDGVKVISPPQRNKLLKTFYALKLWLTTNKSELGNLIFLSFKEKARMLHSTHILQEIMDSVRPDLIHVHSLHNTWTLSLELLQNSIPVIITDHGFWQGIRRKKDLEKIRKTASEADYIICVSNFSRKQLGSHRLAPLVKNKLIHHPMQANKIPLLDRRKAKKELGLMDKKIILFSGIWEPVKRKGLDILLKAIAVNSYLREKCKVVIVTSRDATKYAQNVVKQKEIDNLILGPQPWDKIVRCYNAADVFVMPSRSEGFANVYVEALLAGLPIVGLYWNVSEIEKLLGIYVGERFNASKEDEKTLAGKIIKVLNTDFDREFLRRKVIENLSWEAKFSEFDSVYKQALAGFGDVLTNSAKGEQ